MSTALFSAEHWSRVGELFDRLCECPADDRDLHALDEPAPVIDMLERMLAAHDSDDPQLLDRTVHAVAGYLLGDGETAAVDYAGRRFGPWRALEEIGRGGMAVVLRGERADGRFEKEVAIKLLPQAGSDSERDRLLEEIRILARLEHSNIARLIDGGIDDDETPYLVMEFVRGVPITAYCRRHELDLKARIRLFEQVIEAVHFAHRHLIVHCDIKPDNVLVSDDGQVKLVDFGIAGLVTTGTRARAVSRGLLCSPGYCAPEQMQGAPPATSQDIYNLGAVLYELLCGQRIRAQQAATRLLFGTARIDETIPPPSRYCRGLDPDLDAICTKALSREPEQRYASANALIKDIERWQHTEPVAARNGGRLYHVSRFVSRHRLAVVSAAMLVLLATAGTGATLWQAHQTRAQAEIALAESERARAARDFLVQLFEASDPDVAGGRNLTAHQLLQQGARQIPVAFNEQSHLRGEMLVLLGDLMMKLGRFEESRPLLEEGREVAARYGLVEVHADALLSLGKLEMESGNHEAALTTLRQAEKIIEAAGAVPGSRHALLVERQAFTLKELGRSEQARLYAEAALERARLDPQLPAGTMYTYLFILSNAYLGARDNDRAAELLQQALALDVDDQLLPSARLTLHSNLASILSRQGRLEAALEHSRQAVALADTIYPPSHSTRARMLSNLAHNLNGLGVLDEGETALREALHIYETIYSDSAHPRVAAAHNNLGQNLARRERFEEAEPHLARAHELAATLFGRDDYRYITATVNLGDLLGRMGRHLEAEELLLEGLELERRRMGDDHPRVGRQMVVLARLRLAQHRPADALELIESALELYRRAGFDHPRLQITALSRRAQSLAALGRTAQAHAAFGEAFAAAEAAGPDAGDQWPRLLSAHAEFLVRHEEPQAPAALRKAIEAYREQFGSTHPATQRLQALAVEL